MSAKADALREMAERLPAAMHARISAGLQPDGWLHARVRSELAATAAYPLSEVDQIVLVASLILANEVREVQQTVLDALAREEANVASSRER